MTSWRTGAVLIAGLLLCLAAAPSAHAASEDAKAILRAKGCGSCHKIPGVEGAYGTYGPSLKGLGNRARIVANMLENNAENLKDWLSNPKSVKPDTLMPNMGLSDQEIDTLIKFFDTL